MSDDFRGANDNANEYYLTRNSTFPSPGTGRLGNGSGIMESVNVWLSIIQ